MWHIFDSGIKSAEENMRLDERLLAELSSESKPLLHFYGWRSDSATFGHFIDPSQFLDLEKATKRGLELGRRSTGGGIIFHIWDLAFSVLIPSSHPSFSQNTLENYRYVNNIVLESVTHFLKTSSHPDLLQNENSSDEQCRHFCMAKPTKYDVMLQGKKIAGAAQRKTKQGLLHQGSISLCMPDEEYLKDVLKSTKVLEAMRQNTYPLLAERSRTQLEEVRKSLKEQLIAHFQRLF